MGRPRRRYVGERAGTTGGVVFGEGTRHEWVEPGELLSGFVPVVVVGSFDLPHHDGEEEVDDAVPVVGLVADYIGEGAVVLEDDELLRGVDAVVDPGIFELSLHGGEEETDDEPSALGLLADDVGEGGNGGGGWCVPWRR